MPAVAVDSRPAAGLRLELPLQQLPADVVFCVSVRVIQPFESSDRTSEIAAVQSMEVVEHCQVLSVSCVGQYVGVVQLAVFET